MSIIFSDDLISLDDNTDEDIEPYQHEYCGHRDVDGFRSGQGCQSWLDDHCEKYEGNFLLDNMHGNGVYVVNVGKKRIICSGNFYCNKLEGYAEIIYSNGIFEGLFRHNKKFGPGILTYIDGSQDVGFWFDRTLIRLSCVVLPQWMPKLGRTATGKTYLLQFRNLVPVIPETTEDRATEILKSLNASEEVLKNAHKLYNPYISNPDSLFFNKSLYDDIFFDTKDCYIEVALNEDNGNDVNIREEEESEDDCSCNDPGYIKKQEILKEIASIDNMLYELLEKIKNDDVEVPNSVSEESATGDVGRSKAIDCYEAQVNALINFRETLRNKLADKSKKETKFEKPVSTTKVLVTELLAWNNEKMFTKMLQHCFLHKTTETNMSFNVSKLLAGERHTFKSEAGLHEKVCIEFLTKCSEGKVYDIADIIRKHNLNPDLCDANGNTGITFAVARDKILVIKALANNGANINAINDEGLTPLNLCMARYLAVQYKIQDWERAFLPQVDEDDDEQHSEPQKSTTSVHTTVNLQKRFKPGECSSLATEVSCTTKSFLSKEMLSNVSVEEEIVTQLLNSELSDLTGDLKTFGIPASMEDFQTPYSNESIKEQIYIFNTACVRLMEKPTLCEIREASRRRSSLYASHITHEEHEEPTDDDAVIFDKLEVIRRTMLCLLHYGCDPDAGQVPFPTLVMAVFTQNVDIVENLLENGADPNITTLGEHMTPLHTVASLKPSRHLVEVAEVLLHYKANPNCRASPTHWLLLNASVLGHGFENELPDLGKTPLHLLCMRYDFLSDHSDYFAKLAQMLLRYGANGNDMFLGHSPLSLAVVRGNIRLVEALLDMGCVDPNQKLGRGMGVPLTVLILKRYADVLYFDVCKVILDTLLEGRANPFEPIFDYGNAIDFMQRKHDSRLKAEREQAQKEIRAQKKSKKNKKKKKNEEDEEDDEVEIKTKGKKKEKLPDQVLMQNYLLQRSREVLLKRIQCQVTKFLYQFMDEYIPVDDVIELVQYLTPEIVCYNIELLLREGELSFDDLHFDTLYRLTHFVANANKSITSPSSSKSEHLQTAQEALNILQAMDISEKPKFEGAVHPSVDPDDDKYVVCFYCCRKKGRELYHCPKCEMIYFCSELCNKLCSKSKLNHVCDLIFYKTQKERTSNQHSPAKKLSKKLNIYVSKKSERDAIRKEHERKEKRLKTFGITLPSSDNRRSSIVSQKKLKNYVDIMKSHIEKIEALELDSNATIISLTEIAQDIAEIAKESKMHTSNHNLALGFVRSFSRMVLEADTSILKCESRKVLDELEIQHEKLTKNLSKLSRLRDEGICSMRNIYQGTSYNIVNKRDSVSFSEAQQSIQCSHKSLRQRSSLIEKKSLEYLSKNANAKKLFVKKKIHKKIPGNLTKQESLKLLYENETVQKAQGYSEVSVIPTKPKPKPTPTSSKRRSRSVKHRTPRKQRTASSKKRYFRRSGKSRERHLDHSIPSTAGGDNELESKKDQGRGKIKKLGHYWYHQPFIQRLAKIFPTLDILKLLLPFACFAGGQLYYRFGSHGSTLFTNYSQL